MAETHRSFESEDFFTFWRTVPAPTVLLYGAESPVVNAAGAAKVRTTNPAATISAIPEAGHMVSWDNPTASLEMVRSLLVDLIS